MASAETLQADHSKTTGKPQQARVVAVTSGKGGVGKSNIAVNLSLALAEQGHRVILWDTELGLANVQVLMNLQVEADLSDVIDGRNSLSEIMVETRHGIRVIPGASGDESVANLNEVTRSALLDELELLLQEADYILLDTSAGIGSSTIGFAGAADDIVLVTTPEPTAMLDAYATMKVIHQRAPWCQIHLLVNMARDRREAQMAIQHLSSITERFIKSRFSELGYILDDAAIPEAVRRRAPFFTRAPNSPATESIRAVARQLAESTRKEPRNNRQTGGFIQRLRQLFSGVKA